MQVKMTRGLKTCVRMFEVLHVNMEERDNEGYVMDCKHGRFNIYDHNAVNMRVNIYRYINLKVLYR